MSNAIPPASLKLRAINAALPYGTGTPVTSIRPLRSRTTYKPIPPPRDWMPFIDEVCRRNKVHRHDVLAGYRSKKAARCRQEIWHHFHVELGFPMIKVGMLTGGFHHTTVLSGLRTYAKHKAA